MTERDGALSLRLTCIVCKMGLKIITTHGVIMKTEWENFRHTVISIEGVSVVSFSI